MHDVSTASVPESARFDGRVAIVTGGGAQRDEMSIGRAICRALADRGCVVAVLDRDEAAAHATVDEIVASGGSAFAAVGDVRTSASCTRLVGEVVARAGRLDVLVNNAAVIGRPKGFDDGEDEVDAVLAVNLKGAMWMTKHAMDAMTGGGAIVNISSVAAVQGVGPYVYGMSKAGIEALTRLSATEGGRRGVRVNCVRPGLVWTDMAARLIDPAQRESARVVRSERTLTRTEGTSWDVARAVVFLASDDARWITGDVLTVDGGGLLKAPTV